MKFAAWPWLFGTGLAALVAVLLVVSGVLLLRSLRRFGDDERMAALVTGKSAARRALKGVLLVLALTFAFLAAAQPQYGRGTRRIPATNLDVAIVLDFSKSMYARDVTPSRIERAKSEVAGLIRELPGARFAAVAFAGEPMAFPLTSDGGAIAQFLRQLTPNDMPVGGTAVARALTTASEVLTRDPHEQRSAKVVLLITDGEDLEGNPVAVAKSLASEGITVHVVQIGGRTPEPIPDINNQGEMVGWRTDASGNPLTTSLSAEGEATLAKVAETTGGVVVQSSRGTTGVREIAARLRVLMTEELSEKVETVYADVFHYPLGIAILLLIVETFVAQARVSKPRTTQPPPVSRKSRQRKQKPRRGAEEKRREASRAAVAVVIGLALAFGSVQVSGCDAVDQIFVRNAPQVDQAIAALDAGDASAAVDLLTEYLNTGECQGGELGTPDRVKEQHHASLDLGIGLFRLAEEYGRRFGEEEKGDPESEGEAAKPRDDRVRCALRILRAVTPDSGVPAELRARAHYLAGNLEFLRRNYRDAITEYDQALQLVPGLADAGEAELAKSETIGNDAAWNRAIAVRRLEEQQKDNPDAGSDAQPDAADAGPDASDAGNDGGDADSGDADSGDADSGDADSGDDGASDAGADGAGPDAGDDASDGSGDNAPPDAGGDGGQDAAEQNTHPEDQEPQPEPQEPSEASQDDRILDELEQAPTLQQHMARERAAQGSRRRGMEDK